MITSYKHAQDGLRAIAASQLVFDTSTYPSTKAVCQDIIKKIVDSLGEFMKERGLDYICDNGDAKTPACKFAMLTEVSYVDLSDVYVLCGDIINENFSVFVLQAEVS